MNKVIDFLAFVMTAVTLCYFVRYVVYPGLRLAFRIIAVFARFFARLLQQKPCDAAVEHVAEVCASPLAAAESRQQTNHD